jgi:hypothetical protein
MAPPGWRSQALWPSELSTARFVALIEHAGVSAPVMADLRRAAMLRGARVRVIPNKIAAGLCEGTALETLRALLRGPIAWLLVPHEWGAREVGASLLREIGQLRAPPAYSGRAPSPLKVRAAWFEGALLDEGEFDGRTGRRGDDPGAPVAAISAELAGLLERSSGAAPIADVSDLEALRRRLRPLLSGRPPGEGATDDDAFDEGWRPAPVDAAALLAEVPALWLEPGWALQAFAFRSGANGNGVVWAVPEGAPSNAPAWPSASLLSPPRPPLARPPIEALRGDGSDAALLQAAILLRELGEFAAEWHGVEWGTHRLVDVMPAGLTPTPIFVAGHERPLAPLVDLRPRVEPSPGGGRNVVFYSYTELGRARLIAHVDFVPPGMVGALRSDRYVVAAGPGGYVH